jgi:integrase/recombinase XerD
MKKLPLVNPSYKELITRFGEWLDILGYAQTTAYYLPIQLQEFFYYLEQNLIFKIEDISTKTVKEYYHILKQRTNERQDGALSKSYLNKHQQALKKFNDYLKQHHGKGFNIHLKNEKKPTEEKLNILTLEEITALFEACGYSHKSDKIRLRDKAILVLLYSCGLRRNEAVNLLVSDIMFDKERVYVRKGKNYKERFVPVNRKNARILEDYLYEARPEFYQSYLSEWFLINQRGTQLGGMSLANRLKAIVGATNNQELEEKHITPHCLRHSIATHLLQSEVPIESIKTFLGHTSLESTQIYTHIVENHNQ